MVKKILLISSLAMASLAFSQKTHQVVKGDTPYNISKKYGITLDEFYRLNPKAKDNTLGIGEIVSVGSGKSVGTSVSGVSEQTGKIVLQPKQTLYGLTKQYHLSETEIRKLNPNLQMQIGEEIILPLENIRKYADSDAVAATSNTETPKAETPVVSDANTISKTEDSNYYKVKEKDNYYRITKQFGITKSQLFIMNPGLEEKGLQAGDLIKVKPTDIKETYTLKPDTENIETAQAVSAVSSSTNESSTLSSASDEYVTYTVQSGDTVFGIINKFGITLDQLVSLNPNIVNGLKAGTVLKIKKLDEGYVKKSGDALNVILMLPFGFDTDDSNYRTMATDFLTGAQLAIERNAGRGLKMDVKVVDAGNEKSFKNSLVQINQNNTDLIIGPFFKTNVKEVLDFVGDKKIPVVAPFANSEELYGYSNLIMMESTDNAYADKIDEEITEGYSNQKIYILTDSEEKPVAEYLKKNLSKTLKNPQISIVTSTDDIQLDKNMMTGQVAPVIAVLASKDDNLGKDFTQHIISLSKEVNGLKTYSLFYSSSFEKYEGELGQANLVYLMDRKINTEGIFEKDVLSNYKQKYCKTPSKYAVIGFDIVNDVLSRENKKGEIFKQMGKSQTQLATKFEYARTQNNGAYINTGVRLIRLIAE